MATGKYADLAKDRWDTLTIGVGGSAAEDTNSELIAGWMASTRELIAGWMASTRELLARMVHGIGEDAEYSLLCEAEERLLTAIGDECVALCEAVETMRASRNAVAA